MALRAHARAAPTLPPGLPEVDPRTCADSGTHFRGTGLATVLPLRLPPAHDWGGEVLAVGLSTVERPAAAHPTGRRRWRSFALLTAPAVAIAALAVAGWPGGAQMNDPVARFLIAVTVTLVVCHLAGAVLTRLGQPRVVGEVIGGVALGPSLLGWVWPDGRAWLFTPPVVGAIGMVAQLGLA